MNIVAGIYYRSGKPVEQDRYNNFPLFINALRTSCAANVLFISQQSTTISLDSRLYVIGDIDLYNQEELQTLLCDNGDLLAGSATLVLKAYQKWGKGCLDRLIGNFMFAIWDEKEQTLFCGRDQLGQKPFYYYIDDDIFIFSNTIKFPASFRVAGTLNNDWIERFVTQTQSQIDKEETIYQHIYKLVPAHTLTITQNGFQLEKYWQIGNKKQQKATNIDEAAAIVRQHIETAIKLVLDRTNVAGIELSGGLDSSTLASIGHQYLGDGLYTYSNILPDEYKYHFENFSDESVAIKAIQVHLDLQKHLCIDEVPSEPFSQLEKAIEAIGYPTYMIVNLYQQCIYQKAADDGVYTLLSGFGGDEMVSANTYVPYVSFAIQSGRFAEAVGLVQAHGHSKLKALLHVSYQSIKAALNIKDRDVPDAKESICRMFLKEKYYSNIIGPRLSTHIGIKDWYDQQINSNALVERLETGYHITGSYNICYKYPLLYTPLLEFYYSLPDEWNMQHKYGRTIFRKAIDGLLPPAIVEGNKARNTAVIPTLKIEIEKYFQTLKDWLLSRSQDHSIFQYIDRTKLEKLVRDETLDVRIYGMLKRMVMLTLFFDKKGNQYLYEI